jgi:2-methylaconitate cis-trans-isomerase PrpF
VGIAAAEVDFKPNCGNLTAAVAMYAIQERIVEAVEGITTVRIHNLNTDKIIYADVRVEQGEPLVHGDLAIGGVPGTGSPIALDFSRAGGSATGKLLPMGAPSVQLPVPGYGTIEVSVVDCANLVIFAAADDLGMTCTETPAEIDANLPLVAKINAIRKEVAHRIGLGEYWDSRQVPALPLFFAVQRPVAYTFFTTGEALSADSVDLVCRSYATGSTHQALPTTATACIGAACRIEGSIPARYLSRRAMTRDMIEIGHPSGIIGVESRVEITVEEGHKVHWAKILRTARRLAQGEVFLRG